MQANRTGRKCEKEKGPQRILKNSTARKAIFQDDSFQINYIKETVIKEENI